MNCCKLRLISIFNNFAEFLCTFIRESDFDTIDCAVIYKLKLVVSLVTEVCAVVCEDICLVKLNNLNRLDVVL